MSQRAKAVKVSQGQSRKRNASNEKVDLTAEPPKKRGRPSRVKNQVEAGANKNSKTAPSKARTPIKKFTPVTPEDSPPSANVVLSHKPSNKKRKQQVKQEHTIERRANPPREVRSSVKIAYIAAAAAAAAPNSKPKKAKPSRTQAKQNGSKSSKQSHFQPVVNVEADVECISEDFNNNSNHDHNYVLMEQICRNRENCASEVY